MQCEILAPLVYVCNHDPNMVINQRLIICVCKRLGYSIVYFYTTVLIYLHV